MRLLVNGEERSVPDGATIVGLLEALDLGGERVAVEVNRAIVPRASHGDRILVEGDVVELVHFVGGG